MAQWGNALATKPDNLSSTSGTNTVRNNQRSQTVIRPLFVHPDNSMHTNIHIQIDRQTHTHSQSHTHIKTKKC